MSTRPDRSPTTTPSFTAKDKIKTAEKQLQEATEALNVKAANLFPDDSDTLNDLAERADYLVMRAQEFKKNPKQNLPQTEVRPLTPTGSDAKQQSSESAIKTWGSSIWSLFTWPAPLSPQNTEVKPTSPPRTSPFSPKTKT